MRELGSSTNQIAGICRATISHLLLPPLSGGRKCQVGWKLLDTAQLLWTYALKVLSVPSLISGLKGLKIQILSNNCPEQTFPIDFGSYALDKWQLSNAFQCFSRPRQHKTRKTCKLGLEPDKGHLQTSPAAKGRCQSAGLASGSRACLFKKPLPVYGVIFSLEGHSLEMSSQAGKKVFKFNILYLVT